MANLHVQPKKKNYLWIWILVIVLILIAAGVFYYENYYEKGVQPAIDETSRGLRSGAQDLVQLSKQITLPTV